MKRIVYKSASLVMALLMATGLSLASGSDEKSGKNTNQVPLAGMVSVTNHDGPKTAKHLKIGIWNTAGNITTYTIGNSWNDWLLWLSYDKLREPSPYVGQADDWLATDIKQVSDDARNWEITLRDGVKWHDGTDFTAEDVAFTFEYYREGPANRWTHHTSAVPRMEKIEVLDRLKLRITSKMPMPNFDVITATDLPIIQKAQWENVKNPRGFTDIGIGTGPYMLVDYKADEYYKYKANPNYWKGKPLVEELTLVMIKDPQTMFTALKTGELDGAARSLPPELVKQWAADPDIEIAKAPSLWGTWLDINLARKPFDNRQLRQAISLAIDPEPMLKRVMLGMGKSGTYGWPHVDSFWTRPDMKVSYDPAKAMTILDEQGYVDSNGDGIRDLPDGTPLTWIIKAASNRPLLMRASEMVVSQLAEVGIKSRVETMDPASFAGLWKSREYDLRVMDITPHGIADQDMLIILYKGDSKAALVQEPEKDAIVKRWLEAGTREDRLKVSYELQDYQNKYPNRVMLWYPDGLFAYRWKAYDNYASSAGYGIFHKYSFLPRPARTGTAEELVK
ncbi:ABC transporter substrate-binding protein [Cohaesibacter celericrescens]|nr:ABC transporter substrate-binding protein [Cohaesibacter celericrescens]